MGTLLLRLAGPMQSWGVQSHFTHRDTGLEPSKSGVIGLICAALGKPRDESHPANVDKPPLATLADLRMGVRVDREGLIKKDYHTAKDVMKASKNPFVGLKDTELSERFYLADAVFLVGLESTDFNLLQQIAYRLRKPVWMLFLGRKAFVPSEPIWLKDGGLRPDMQLEDALISYQRLAPSRDKDARTRLVIEDPQHGSIIRPDQPISFAMGKRQFTVRRVRMDFCIPPDKPQETP